MLVGSLFPGCLLFTGQPNPSWCRSIVCQQLLCHHQGYLARALHVTLPITCSITSLARVVVPVPRKRQNQLRRRHQKCFEALYAILHHGQRSVCKIACRARGVIGIRAAVRAGRTGARCVAGRVEAGVAAPLDCRRHPITLPITCPSVRAMLKPSQLFFPAQPWVACCAACCCCLVPGCVDVR